MSEQYVVVLAIILIFSSLLDTATTSYILRTNPELFHANEGGLLASHFKDTPLFWIGTLGYAFVDSTILFIGYFCNPKNNNFIKLVNKLGFDEKANHGNSIRFLSFGIRLESIVFAFFGTIFAINWMKYIY